MTKDDALELLRAAKEMGLCTLKLEGFEVTFPDTKTVAVRPAPIVGEIQNEKELIKALMPNDMPSEEEVLYWATPFYDDLQSQKELKNKHKEEAVNG